MVDGGHGSSSTSIYGIFVEISIKISQQYVSLIMPSRWMTGGKGLDSFRAFMINNHHINILHDYMNASELFSNASIEGGICYFLFNSSKESECFVVTHKSDGSTTESKRYLDEGNMDIVVRDEIAIEILNKVKPYLEKGNFSQLVSKRNPFNIGSNVENIISDKSTSIKILCRKNYERAVCYLKEENIPTKNTEYINSYKLFISKADGAAGQIGNPIPAKIIGKVEIGYPKMVCSETFLMVGPFKNEEISVNVKEYMTTKFFRFLVGIRKNKNMTSETYSFVPLIDFSNKVCDAELYRIFGLSVSEINYIEKMIS